MTQDEATAWLTKAGLRIPEGEMASFAGLSTEMEQAAEIARRPLSYQCESASTFNLAPAPTKPLPPA